MATMPAKWVFREAGSFAAMSLDTARAAFQRPVQWREFVQQLWFVASVSILPTCLVAIPFGAIIALQTGDTDRPKPRATDDDESRFALARVGPLSVVAPDVPAPSCAVGPTAGSR